MPLSLRKVSGIVCTIVAGSFASQASANVDRTVCTNVCRTVCDTRVTNNWYPFDAQGNFAPNDPNPNRCKKRIGSQRQECQQVCRRVGTHAALPEESDEFLDDFLAEDLMTDIFFDEAVAQQENLSSQCGTALVQCDNTPPTCTSRIDWTARPILIEVDTCTDNLSGCDPASEVPREFDRNDQPRGAEICDIAGNCIECAPIPEDNEPPDCVATFEHPDRWHRGEDFETDPPLRCWLESCTDTAAGGEVASGCLQFPVNNETVAVFNDPQGENETINVENEPLQPVNGDTCMIEVCDNAGWCNTCESPPLQYDDSAICQNGGSGLGKTADGVLCGECDPDDDDCLCLKGDASKCRDDGPVNCYTNPFHDRCPGFQNPACLADPFTPGCPVVNPCYPIEAYDGLNCPLDAIRFCARNPYHYGCNLACANGGMNCDPVPPGDAPGGGDGGDTCPVLPTCGAGETLIDDGIGADGCAIGHCEASNQLAGIDQACPSSGSCQTGLYCTVDDGVCDQNPGCTGDTCTTECWGTCVEEQQ